MCRCACVRTCVRTCVCLYLRTHVFVCLFPCKREIVRRYGIEIEGKGSNGVFFCVMCEREKLHLTSSSSVSSCNRLCLECNHTPLRAPSLPLTHKLIRSRPSVAVLEEEMRGRKNDVDCTRILEKLDKLSKGVEIPLLVCVPTALPSSLLPQMQDTISTRRAISLLVCPAKLLLALSFRIIDTFMAHRCDFAACSVHCSFTASTFMLLQERYVHSYLLDCLPCAHRSQDFVNPGTLRASISTLLCYVWQTGDSL